jgi:hypothetical protein
MTTTNDQLQITGGVTQALLDALNQVHSSVAAQLTNPDGSPSGTAVYMHLPVGRPIDPMDYAKPWTPMGGDSDTTISDGGQFAAPAPAPVATGATPAAALAAAPPAPDPQLEHSIKAAFMTSRLVDDMLMITDKGIAKSWPQHTVSIEYFTALAGMQAEPVPSPAPDVQKRIDEAQHLLYTFDDQGNMTGYTPKYSGYRHNQKAWTDAVSANAAAYAQAMADPVAGQAWPVTSAKYQNDIDQAYADLYAMGGKEIEEAIATLRSVGGSAAAALIEKAHKMYDAYAIGLAGAVGDKVPWSYIDPSSWWDHNNKDFGVITVSSSSTQYQASGGGGGQSFAHQFYADQSSSTSGSVGYSFCGFGASANASHSDSSSDSGQNADSSSWQHFQDASSSATVTFDYFLASIERPWLLGDLFHMDGWYMVGQPKNCISDGTVEGQLKDDSKLLPMIPKGFLIVRNVKIWADSWGQAASAFQSAMSDATNHTDSSSTSYGGSVGWCGIGGSVQHSNSDDNGAFTQQSNNSNGWSFEKHDQGGTLTLTGSQIVGWIGEIQPASPKDDAPTLTKKDGGKDDSGSGTTGTGTSAVSGTAPGNGASSSTPIDVTSTSGASV